MIDAELVISPEAARFLGLTEEKIKGAIRDAVDETLIEGQRMIVDDTPRVTSTLRNSIGIIEASEHSDGTMGGQIVAYSNIAPYVEYGTGIHSENPNSNKQPIVIRAKQASSISAFHSAKSKGLNEKMAAQSARHALRFVIGDRVIYAQSVTIKGMKPAAMFRKNLAAIQELLRQNQRKRLLALLRGQ